MTIGDLYKTRNGSIVAVVEMTDDFIYVRGARKARVSRRRFARDFRPVLPSLFDRMIWLERAYLVAAIDRTTA